MKKHIYPIMLLLLSAAASAQVVQKGDKLVGGSLAWSTDGFDPTASETGTNATIGIFPSFSFAVKDNLAIGVKINFSKESFRSGVDTSRRLIYGGVLFLKKYKVISDRFGLYFNHGISAMEDEDKHEYAGVTYKNYARGYG